MKSFAPVCLELFAITTVLLTMSLAGCSGEFRENPGLLGLAGNLAEPQPAAPNPLALSIDSLYTTGEPRLRCRLVNISAAAVDVRQSHMPCTGFGVLSVVGISTDGHPMLLSPGLFSHLTNDPEEVITIQPRAAIIEEAPLQNFYPINENSRSRDVLLLWSFRNDKYLSTGIAVLPKMRAR